MTEKSLNCKWISRARCHSGSGSAKSVETCSFRHMHSNLLHKSRKCRRYPIYGRIFSLSIALDFDINRQNYRPGNTGQGTYSLTYIGNDTEVINATFEWKTEANEMIKMALLQGADVYEIFKVNPP